MLLHISLHALTSLLLLFERMSSQAAIRIPDPDLLMLQVAIITALGPLFGLSRIQAARSGLLLAAGGEFAFVAL